MSPFFAFTLSRRFTDQPQRAEAVSRVSCTYLFGFRLVFEVLIDANTVRSIHTNNNILKTILCSKFLRPSTADTNIPQPECKGGRADYNSAISAIFRSSLPPQRYLRDLRYFSIFSRERQVPDSTGSSPVPEIRTDAFACNDTLVGNFFGKFCKYVFAIAFDTVRVFDCSQ